MKIHNYEVMMTYNDLTDDGNVSFLLSKHTVDYFILGEFHWNICISKDFKGAWQFCPLFQIGGKRTLVQIGLKG